MIKKAPLFRRLRGLLVFLSVALPLAPAVADYDEAIEYLDTDGALLAYLNFSGDGAEIAAALNAIYADVTTASPELPPIPLDFNQLFRALGFHSLEAFAMSSKEIEPGLHRNRSVTLFQGAPAGLMSLYGVDEAGSFTAAELAPADASGAITATLDLKALETTAIAVLQQAMGPMGEGLIRQQLSQTVPSTSLTYARLLEALSGKVDGFWRQTYEDDLSSEFEFFIQFESGAGLLADLRPWLEGRGIEAVTEGSRTRFDLSSLLPPEATFELYAETTESSGALRIYTSVDWNHETPGPRLSADPSFRALAERLPAKGIAFNYSAEADMGNLLAAVKMFPEAAPYAPAIESAYDFLIGPYMQANFTVSRMEGEVMISDQLAGFSTKQVVTTVPLMIGGGLTAAMAVPAFQKVRQESQKKAVTNNLRQLAAAADQYFLENGVTEVRATELYGTYLDPLKPVAGENYDKLVLRSGQPIRVLLRNGTEIVIDF
jgi:type IV pilus assembly protein PilA